MRHRMQSWHRWGVASLLVLFTGLLQYTDLFSWFGVKPNYTLATLIVLAFFLEEWFIYLGLVLFAAILLNFRVVFDAAIGVFMLVCIFMFAFRRFFPAIRFVNSLVAVLFGTILFYGIIDYQFLLENPFTIFIELVYNIGVGIVTYALAAKFFGYAKEF